MNKDSGQHPSPNYSEDELLEHIRSLPPRSVTHKKRKESKSERFLEDDEILDNEDESQEEEPQKKRSFPLIQIMLYTFLAVIITFFIFWYWQQQQIREHEASVDPFQRLVEQGGLNQPEEAGEDTNNPAEQEAEQEKPESEPNQEVTDDSSISSGDKDSSNPAGEENQVAHGDKSEPPANSDSADDQRSSERKILAEHIVQPNETFYRITVNYYGDKSYMNDLATFNGISDITKIYSGMKILIPEMP